MTLYAGTMRRVQSLFPFRSLALICKRLQTLNRLLCAITRSFWYCVWAHISKNPDARPDPIAPYITHGSSASQQPQHFTKSLLGTTEADFVDLRDVACSLYPESHGTHRNSWPSLSGTYAGIQDNVLTQDLQTTGNGMTGPACIDFNPTSSANLRAQEITDDLVPYVHSSAYIGHPRIKPAVPEAMSRYDTENRKYRYSHVLDSSIDLLNSPLLRKPDAPRGWSELIYPEGGRYFHNKEKKIYTDADLHNSIILREVQEVAKIIEDFISVNSVVIPSSAELVLDVVSATADSVQTTYYFVNHAAKSIFFLDPYEHEDIISSPGQLRQYIEAQYWYHTSMYPHSLVLSSEIIKDLRDTAIYFIADRITSSTSTSPHGEDVLSKILDVTASLNDSAESYPIGVTAFIARFMYIFASSRYWNHAGERHARLGRDQSIHGQVDYHGTWFLKTFSVLLFFLPNGHYKNMQNIWVDHIVYAEQWAKMFRVLNLEWQGYVFLSAILLNANIVFLLAHKWHVYRPTMLNSPIQIVNYASITTCLGSIIMGLFLMAQTAGKKHVKDAEKVQNYINNRVLPRIGLEALAVLYSLPYAFLIWSILYFSLALFLEFLHNSNNAARAIIVSLTASIIIVSWWLCTAWPKIFRNRPFQSQSHQPSQNNQETKTQTSWYTISKLRSIYSLFRLPWASLSPDKSTSAA